MPPLIVIDLERRGTFMRIVSNGLGTDIVEREGTPEAWADLSPCESDGQ